MPTQTPAGVLYWTNIRILAQASLPLMIKSMTIRGFFKRFFQLLLVYIVGCLTLDLPGAFYLLGAAFVFLCFSKFDDVSGTEEWDERYKALLNRYFESREINS